LARNLFLSLLLANLLVLAWQRWIVPPEVDQPLARRSPGSESQLVLVGRPGRPAAEAAGDERETGTTRCMRVGPFADDGAAGSVARRLTERGIRVSRSSRRGRVWIGHWVQVTDLPDGAAASAAVDRLNEAGIVDAYIASSSPEYKVSLGVFRDADRAQSTAGIARRIGLEPVVADRYREGREYWLKATLAPGQALMLRELAADGGGILRTEAVPCDTPGAADGDAGNEAIESDGPGEPSPE